MTWLRSERSKSKVTKQQRQRWRRTSTRSGRESQNTKRRFLFLLSDAMSSFCLKTVQKYPEHIFWAEWSRSIYITYTLCAPNDLGPKTLWAQAARGVPIPNYLLDVQMCRRFYKFLEIPVFPWRLLETLWHSQGLPDRAQKWEKFPSTFHNFQMILILKYFQRSKFTCGPTSSCR